jgi:hypothetical protein
MIARESRSRTSIVFRFATPDPVRVNVAVAFWEAVLRLSTLTVTSFEVGSAVVAVVTGAVVVVVATVVSEAPLPAEELASLQRTSVDPSLKVPTRLSGRLEVFVVQVSPTDNNEQLVILPGCTILSATRSWRSFPPFIVKLYPVEVFDAETATIFESWRF